ncbi:MAG: alginate export family protein [Nitrospirota bacterium]
MLKENAVKLVEGVYGWHSDDIDGNAALATYKLDKDNTVGAYYAWIRNDELSSVGIAYPGAIPKELNLQNPGVHANGEIRGFTYAAEVDLQFGDLARAYRSDVDYEGYGLFAKVGYKLHPIVNLRGSFAYGSGDDNPNDDRNEEFQVIMGLDTIGPFSRFIHYTQIYERTIRTAVANPINASQGQTLSAGNTRNTNIANTTYYNLGIDVMPTRNLILSVDGYVIQASEEWTDGEGNTIDDDVGTEVDLRGSYKIAKNLTYFVEAGFFSPGDYYDSSLVNTTGVGAKTVTQIIHGLSFTF